MGQQSLVHRKNQIPNHLSLKMGIRCTFRAVTACVIDFCPVVRKPSERARGWAEQLFSTSCEQL